MSWTISLSGPKEVVLQEMNAAVAAIKKAAAHLSANVEADPKDSVSASVNGYVSWDSTTGAVKGSSTGHSVGVSRYVPPQPPQADAPAVPETTA